MWCVKPSIHQTDLRNRLRSAAEFTAAFLVMFHFISYSFHLLLISLIYVILLLVLVFNYRLKIQLYSCFIDKVILGLYFLFHTHHLALLYLVSLICLTESNSSHWNATKFILQKHSLYFSIFIISQGLKVSNLNIKHDFHITQLDSVSLRFAIDQIRTNSCTYYILL